jgi:hypothetical protein
MDNYELQQARLGNFQVIPAIGGQNTYRERAALGFGARSLVQNCRCWNPGYETRLGYTKLCTTPTNASQESVLNIFQFSKGKRSEQDVFVQYGNGELHKQNASMTIPTQYAGAFGSAAYTGTDPGTIPGSFSVVDDYMLYANGTDQHKIYAGTRQQIEVFVISKDTTTHLHLPRYGVDWSTEVTDKDSVTYAEMNMGDYTNDYDAAYIMTKTPIDELYFEVHTPNAQTGTMELYHWKGWNWSIMNATDNTEVATATLAQSGTLVPADNAATRTAVAYGTSQEVPRLMFGRYGYWYMIRLDATGGIDSSCKVSQIEYTTNSFASIENVWNGIETDMVEAWFYDASDTCYYNYGSTAINISDMTSSDYIYVASPYQLSGIYIDFGNTVNTNTSTPSIDYWTGTAWDDVNGGGPGSFVFDGTNSMSNSGWYIWAYGISNKGLPPTESKQEFQNNRYYSYVYRIAVSATLSSSLSIAAYGMPRFDIGTFGQAGRVNGSWKNRALYTFEKFPRDIYVSETNEPLKLNGTDYTILEPGDGRANATTAIVNFYNEIMVFQEEKGTAGGCVTIFEGYSPATFGKLLLSTKVGTFSPKSVVVVDGSKVSQTQTDLTSQTQVYFISHYGVFMSDGKVVTGISDQIQNYFDPRESECLRTGYENEMWLSHDSTENVLKMGIVSGSSATKCNKFFVYDLVTGEWYEDTYNDSISAWCGSRVLARHIPGRSRRTMFQRIPEPDFCLLNIQVMLFAEIGIWLKPTTLPG